MSPYKDPEKQKEAVRKAVEKHRQGITAEGITGQGITEEEKRLSKFPNQVIKEKVVIRDGVEMPRFITLSDGQILDRAYKPDIKALSGGMIQSLKAINAAGFKPNAGNIGKLKTRYDIREI